MIPFKQSYYQNKIDEFRKKCSNDRDCTLGELKLIWELRIDKRLPGYMHAYKGDMYYSPHLYRGDQLVMAVDGEEVGGIFEIVKKAHGKVGIVGLGLGYSVQEMINKESVTEIIVYEINKDVIELYNKNFEKNDKVKIIEGDAFEAKGEKFDYFFVDIYDRRISKQIVDDFHLFKEKHDIKDYVFFGVEKFILSLFPTKYESENIPKLWKNMAEITGERFRNSKYVENFAGYSLKKTNELFEAFEF
ncbi:hypothetical protein [Oceanirhabdus sp. W0125-5]|uniref:hypothetical protein n=1 Tax=Oceanirhabdus sp. W0125-5 TaxID=2999116 RepID=UPI0022F2C0B0|nr:hypothetical protein [Oceanirhabdus sp. W0125-5]WBW99135.1 hypothetical protein OW730_10420 [Oceanirhabdus sp. W0125-5]